MDTPTQALLGATFGQAFFGHRLGRKAAWFGAVAASLPDLDSLVAKPLGPLASWIHHRGVSHALWFGPVVGALLGWAVWRLYARRRDRRLASDTPPTPPAGAPPGALDPGEPRALRWWIGLFVVAIVTHPLLDIFTSYGTQLLAPFSRHRFAWDAVAVIDPAYSLVLVVALLVGSRFRRHRLIPRFAAGAALILTTGYLFLALQQNARAVDIAESQLSEEAGYPLAEAEVHAWPTLFQPYLRRVVARTPDEVRVGFVSTWAPRRIHWRRFDVPQGPAVIAARATWQADVMQWFAMGWVLPQVERTDDGVVVRFYDLRYGLVAGDEPGMWGIEARFERGHAPGAVARLRSIDRFRGTIDRVGERFVALWQATFDGDTSRL